MKDKTKRRLAVLLFVLAVAGSVACGGAGIARPCYSDYPGCDATAEAIATAAAHGR